MSNIDINAEFMSLTPSALVELFVIDTTEIEGNKLPISEQTMYLHNHVTTDLTPVYFDGQKYNAAPCEYKKNEMKSDSTQTPRPVFTITNYGGYVSRVLRQTSGLIGAKVTRRRVYAKFLDTLTWPNNPPSWSTPNINNYTSEDIYLVNKKTSESKDSVELELATGLELEGVRLPKRKMFANACVFEYRNSSGCPHSGAPVADVTNKKFFDSSGYNLTANDRGEWSDVNTYNAGDYVYINSTTKTKEGSADPRQYFYTCVGSSVIGPTTRPSFDSTNWIPDQCSKKLNGCSCRFSSSNLPFGGFAALSRSGF